MPAERERGILLLADDMEIGGVPRHVVDLAHGLAGRGWRVSVAAAHGPLVRQLQPSVEFVDLSATGLHFGHNGASVLVRSLFTLASYCRSRNIGAIHSHKRFSDAVGRLVALWLNIPHISTCHNRFSDRRLFSVFGQRTIALTGAGKENLVRRYRKRAESVSVIHAGVRPFRRYTPGEKAFSRAHLGISEKALVLASVANFEPRKDHRTLLAALGRCSPVLQQTNAIVLLVGGGEEKGKLVALSQQLGLGQVVRFLPPESDVEAVCNVSDLLVLASRQEEMPYVLLEAATVGKAHIAADVGGISEFIEHGKTGLLVPPGDVTQLAAAIERVIGDQEFRMRMGEKAADKVAEVFGYEEFIEKTNRVYEEEIRRTKSEISACADGVGSRPSGMRRKFE